MQFKTTSLWSHEGIPCGTAYRSSMKFLELEEPLEVLTAPEKKHSAIVNGMPVEIRWLGHGYFLATPVGMAETCGTENEGHHCKASGQFIENEVWPAPFILMMNENMILQNQEPLAVCYHER